MSPLNDLGYGPFERFILTKYSCESIGLVQVSQIASLKQVNII